MGYTTYTESITLSLGILPYTSIGFLLALFLLLAFLTYISSRSTFSLLLSSLSFKSKAKSDMASVMTSREPTSKSKMFGLSKANFLDESPEFDHPTLLPHRYVFLVVERLVRDQCFDMLQQSCPWAHHP